MDESSKDTTDSSGTASMLLFRAAALLLRQVVLLLRHLLLRTCQVPTLETVAVPLESVVSLDDSCT